MLWGSNKAGELFARRLRPSSAEVVSTLQCAEPTAAALAGHVLKNIPSLRQPFSLLSEPSRADVDSLPEGSVVELRSHKKRLLGYGFVEHKIKEVHLFHAVDLMTTTQLPTPGEEYFAKQFQLLVQQREQQLPSVTTCCRVSNGIADGFPGLFVDRYTSTCARIIAGTAAGERLVPVAVNVLRARGLEQLRVDLPLRSASDGVSHLFSLTSKPIPLIGGGGDGLANNEWVTSAAHYQEHAVLHLWVTPQLPAAPLLPLAFRDARLHMCSRAKSHDVLCVNDTCASMSLVAAPFAKSVTAALLGKSCDRESSWRFREAFRFNHGTKASVTVIEGDTPAESQHGTFGVVSVECFMSPAASGHRMVFDCDGDFCGKFTKTKTRAVGDLVSFVKPSGYLIVLCSRVPLEFTAKALHDRESLAGTPLEELQQAVQSANREVLAAHVVPEQFDFASTHGVNNTLAMVLQLS